MSISPNLLVRSVRPALLAAALCTTPLLARSAQQRPATDYWPMKEGSSWVLNAKVGENKMEQTVTVTSAKREAGAVIATLTYKSNDRIVNVETYRVTPDSVERITSGPDGSIKVSPPIPIIRYPLKTGKSWKWSGTVTVASQPVKAESTFTVTGPHKIQGPAGSFNAFQVHSALVMDPEGRKISMPNDFWFAAGVGPVRQSATIAGSPVTVELMKHSLK